MSHAPRHPRPHDASARTRARRQGPAWPAAESFGAHMPHADAREPIATFAHADAREPIAAFAHADAPHADAGTPLAPLAGASRLARISRAFSYARALAARFASRATALAITLAAGVAFAAPPAGTPVDNTAGGSGVESAGGVTLQPVSNTVRATVQPLEALALTRRAPLTARPGDAVSFAHRLRNRGNTPSDFRLDLANLGGDGFDLAALELRHDADGDGLPGPGDPPLAIGGSVALAAGDSIALLVLAQVPLAAPFSSQAHAALVATSLDQGATETAVDTVLTAAGGPPPAIAFYTGADFASPTRRSPLGAPLFLQATAAQANVRPTERDTVVLRLDTQLGRDSDEFLAAETGANTGVFRIVPAVTTLAPTGATALVGDGVVALRRGEQVTATLFGWGATETRTVVWVDPAAVVFDSRTGLGLAGARVRLVDVTGAGNGGRPGELARVFAADGVTPASADVTSDADGRVEFPWAPPSTYRLLVGAPEPYRFPSLVAMADLPGAHVLDLAASYGEPFPHTVDGAPVVADVPVDAVQPVVLFAEKTASRPDVEIGDDLAWQVRVANGSDSTVRALRVVDTPPAGFAYVAGSARVAGLPADDPACEPGALVFAIGDLAPRATLTLSYRMRVGPGASLGDALNRAVAAAGDVRSNEAVARVRVRGGVFADDGIVMGTVGLDADRDGRLSAAEPGLPGVRLVLDDGTWAITDERGRYSFTGVTPRTHTLKVDPATVPSAAVLIPLDHRTGETPGLRFVDLTRGELVRADFAAQGDTAMLREVSERRASAMRRETDRLLARTGNALDRPLVVGDPRTLPASRVTTGENGLPLARASAPTPAPRRTLASWNGTVSALAPDASGQGLASAGVLDAPANDGALVTPAPETVPGGDARPTRAPVAAFGSPTDSATTPAARLAALPPGALAAAPLEQVLPSLDHDLGFIGLADLDTVSVTQIAVRVKGLAGTPLVLRVNGRALPDSRVARRVVAPATGAEAWEYLGVELKPGVNVLEVAPPYSLGRIAVRLVAPGPLAALAMETPRWSPADGFTPAMLELRLTDAQGVPVGTRTRVTLESTLGRLRVPDLDPATPGVQIAVEGGRASVPLEPPAAPGVARLTAATGEFRAAAELPFTTELRALLAVGTLEGVIGWHGFSRRGTAADAREARFEAPLETFASTSRDGRASAAAHGALYLKGRVAGPWSLTLGLDSDRARDERRERDLRPDEGYAVVGDASVRGYDAQSTGKLYTRLERPGAWLHYGDYVTHAGGESNGRSLAAYSRSFTGAQAHWENAEWRVDAFTSRDRTHARTEELRGLGISGPYRLAAFPIVENSERIEVIVRDRDHASVVLSTSARARFTDYELEPFTGRIVFRTPVPSFDAAMNPVFVRVTYEIRTEDGGPGGDPFWVHGGRARWQATPRLALSGTVVDDHDPTGARELRGAGFRAQVAARTHVEGEWARLVVPGADEGQAARVEVTHAADGLEARAWGSSTGSAFDNPSAGYAAGRNEAGGRLVTRVGGATRLAAEFSFSGDAAGRERRGGGQVSLDRAIATAWRGEFGVRVTDGTARANGEDPLVAALRGKIAWQPPAHPEWVGWAEAEQDVMEFERRMAALGAEYRVRDRGRVYARHEVVSSLSNTWDLNGAQQRLATVVGVDADVRRDEHLFGEYRLANVLAGREAQAAVGLRGGWPVGPGTRLGASFERVSALGEARASDGATTAATLSVDFTGPTGWKGSSRLELRANRADTQVLQTLAAAVPLDSAWTGVFRHAVSVTDANGAGQTGEARARVQLGLAWRPGGPWEGLARWELRYDRGTSAIAPSAFEGEPLEPWRRRVANVVSVHADGRVADRDVVSLAWAGKLTREEALRTITAGGGQWLRLRATRDLARGWDVGWSASALTGRRWSQRRWGLGAEVGRQLPMGAWLSAGFNRFGYRDDELTGEDWTREGAYLRLRLKLDESLLRRGEGGPR